MTTNRILLIDSHENAGRLTALLTANGYHIQLAESKTDAETAITTWKPDLIIANIFHPHFSSEDFVRDLKKTAGAENQKVLFLSQQGLTDTICGEKPVVAAYLTKPIDLEKLAETVEHAAPTDKDTKKTILLVEPDAEDAEITRLFLESKNYHPAAVTTAEAAKQFLSGQTPAAIITELLLPDANGLEFVNAIIKDNQTKNIPVIAVSGLRLNEFVNRGQSTGYPELVAAAISDETILQAVYSLIKEAENAAGAQKTDRPKVLVAEDQPILLELMKTILEQSGFTTITACDGREAIEKCHQENPDIAVLDYDMPYKNAFTISEELKADALYASTPIMILTAFSDKQLKLKGLSLGIDDFMQKPVDMDELVARIRMILRRTKQVLDSNPLTRLPGNPSIQARIEREIAKGTKFAVLYVDLNQFKAYNDIYGFAAGDKIIKSTATILVGACRKTAPFESFIGHIGGDDFIVVTPFERAEPLAKQIISDFDRIAPSFYTEEDRKRGYIVTTDRRGNLQEFGLLSVAIAVVHNGHKELSSLAQISHIGTDLKHHAKSQPGSAYAMDRRSTMP